MQWMAIRFQCPACSQPIEVDDGWALKAVTCPYCRKTITSPSESTLGDLSRIPMASPLIFGDAAVALPTPAVSSSAASGSAANPTAVAAFILACLTVVLMVSAVTVAYSHSLDLEQFQKELQQRSTANPGSPLQAIMEYVSAHGGRFPGWFVAVGLLQISGMATSVAAAVCGLLALRRSARRPLAVIALASCGGIVLLFCLNLFIAFARLGFHR